MVTMPGGSVVLVATGRICIRTAHPLTESHSFTIYPANGTGRCPVTHTDEQSGLQQCNDEQYLLA